MGYPSPSVYKELTYIESSRSQRIDTGIYSGNGYSIEMVVSINDFSSRNCLFGINGSHGESFFRIDNTGNYSIWARSVGGSTYTDLSFSANVQYTFKAEFLSSTARLYRNGTLVRTLTPSSSDSYLNYNIPIFCENSTGSLVNYSAIKMYSCKLWNSSGSLERDLIPVQRISDNKNGMYDTVNDVFYTDANGGNFIAGTVVSPWKSATAKYIKVGSVLPSAYRELEYIESTGSQYIDTGFVPNSDTKIVADFFATTIDGATFFYGSGVTYNDRNVELYGNSYASLEVHYSGYYQMTTAVNNRWFHFIQDKNVNTVQVNGSTVATYTFPTKSYSCPYTLYIFALHRASIYNTGSAVRCSKFEMYNNGVLALNLIPCERISDNAIGMYDTVSNRFFGNQGSGSFTKGNYVNGGWKPVTAMYIKVSDFVTTLPSAYQEVDYIEANGNQYINTGISQQALWEYDIQFTDTTSRQLMGYGGSGSEYWGTTGGIYVLASWITPQVRIPVGNRDILTQYYFQNNTGCYVNGTYLYSNGWTDISGKIAQIFAIGGSFLNKAKLWSCKVWSNEAKTNLIRDFVPCYRKSDGVIGLYDRVGNGFYTNSGTGTFLKGADKYSWMPVNSSYIRVRSN